MCHFMFTSHVDDLTSSGGWGVGVGGFTGVKAGKLYLKFVSVSVFNLRTFPGVFVATKIGIFYKRHDLF